MSLLTFRTVGLICVITLPLTACSGGLASIPRLGGLFGNGPATIADTAQIAEPTNPTAGSPPAAQDVSAATTRRRGLFGGIKDDPDRSIQVNKYIWAASLDVLNFLPLQSADPFTGVISTGYGTPPGGGRAYRATILIQDPALDARSLRVSLQTRGGPVSVATARAIEDAILTRARQLRVADGRL